MGLVSSWLYVYWQRYVTLYSPGGPSGDASANVVRKSRRWMERAWKAEYTCACVMSWSCACGASQGPARLRSSHPRPGAGSAARGAAAGMRRTPHDAALHSQAPALSRSYGQPGHALAARAR